MEQGQAPHKDSVSAGDYLSLSPWGAQSMNCTRVIPWETKGLTFVIPGQSVIGQVCGGQSDLEPQGRWEMGEWLLFCPLRPVQEKGWLCALGSQHSEQLEDRCPCAVKGSEWDTHSVPLKEIPNFRLSSST